MNLNVVLRHELHALINRASADQLFTALHSPQSPIRDRFIKFLALSYADWLSTQNDIDDDDIKKEWKHALRMQPNGFAFNMINNQGDDYKGDKSSADKPYTSSMDTGDQNKSSPLSNIDRNGSSSSMGNTLGNGAGDTGMNGLNGGNGHQLQLNEKIPMEGFKRLYTESEGELQNKLKKIITEDKNYNQLIESISPNDYNQSIINDPDNNILDQITGNDNDKNDATPISIEQENMRKYFELLTTEQQQLLKSKLPLLSDITTLDKRNEILIKKLQLCATTFDFLTTNPLELKGIEKKKQMLTEILEYIARYSWYNEQILERCIKTISGNLFRALPRSGKNPDVEDEPFEDPAWAHLQLIYDLTLRLVINTDVDKKTMKKYLEGEFVDNVIELFASEDPREREYLKTILHRIEGRFMPLRALIRQSIANCCYRTIYEQYTVNFDYHDDIIDYNNGLIHNDGTYQLNANTFKYDNPNAIQKKALKRMDKRYYQNSIRNENGIAEFLEIFCSIIHGFSIPVKKEHKDFLRNVLVPLHKCRKLEKFHEQLVACCVQFVFKDPSVAPVILGGLLKFWPIQSPTKEEMFIAEVVNVVNAMINHKNGFSWPENKEICLSVIDTLVECMKSHHHSVAERALLVWGEDAIEILIDLDKKTIWPKIVEAFLDNKNHWNESLRECNEEAMDVFKVRDPQTFNRIREEYERKQKINNNSTAGGPNNANNKNDTAKQEKQQRRMDKWKKIKQMAQQKNASK